MPKDKSTVLAIDFDGTCVTHEYPKVGKDVPHAVETLKALVSAGHQLILYTMRHDNYLQDAIDWFNERDIELYGVQRNPTQDKWSKSLKCYAHVYIDDAALGCPLDYTLDHRPVVDWKEVQKHLVNRFILGEINPDWEDKCHYFVKFKYYKTEQLLKCRIVDTVKGEMIHLTTVPQTNYRNLAELKIDIEYWRRYTTIEVERLFGK